MTFDPYYKWLGIPPDEQPPDHYRLLGLSLFEQNTDAIDNAADRQMAHVRTFQAGPQGADSQRLLNEIAGARIVLLDPTKKRAYDDQLRRQQAPEQPPLAITMPVPMQPASPMIVAVAAVAEFPLAAAAVRVQARESPVATRKPPKDLTVEIIKIIGGGIAGIALATILLRFGLGIDMTGLFPVEQPRPAPNVVKKPKPVEKKKSAVDAVNTTPVMPGGPSIDSATEVMEEYDEPTPGGTVKKKRKVKKKKSSPTVEQAVVATAPSPTESSPANASPPGESPAKPTESGAAFRVTSATLLPRRLPAPADSERQAAEQQLESTYQLSKLKEDAEKGMRAVELLALGLDRRARPAERFVTLRAAADLAADAGDARTVSQAIDALAQTFEPDVFKDEAALLAKAARGARTAEQMKAIVEASRASVQMALANHEYILARDLASAVRNASDRPAGQPYRKFIYDGQREIVRQQQAWYAYQEALTTLATKPDDADANLAAAKWWILERGDWDAALRYLARAGNPRLKTAAELDEAKGNDRLAIANAWYDAGQAEPVTVLWLLRASRWYAAIDKSQISGIDGALVDRRLAELEANEQLQPAWGQIAQGRGAARLHASLAPVVRRHCVLAMPFERADHFHNGKSFMICDRSGQANHGALHGVKPASGQAGMALEFAGTEHFVECPDQPTLNPTGAITVCAWVQERTVISPGGADDIISKEEWGSGSGRGYALRIHLGLPNFNFGNGPDWLQAQSSQAIDLATWVHLAAIYDGQNEVLLVNGIEVGVQPTTKSIAVSPTRLRIGRGPFAQERRFHGLIDEVAIFDMALTPADLQAIIDLGRAGKSLAE